VGDTRLFRRRLGLSVALRLTAINKTSQAPWLTRTH
jgi:hypothetical protein